MDIMYDEGSAAFIAEHIGQLLRKEAAENSNGRKAGLAQILATDHQADSNSSPGPSVNMGPKRVSFKDRLDRTRGSAESLSSADSKLRQPLLSPFDTSNSKR